METSGECYPGYFVSLGHPPCIGLGLCTFVPAEDRLSAYPLYCRLSVKAEKNILFTDFVPEQGPIRVIPDHIEHCPPSYFKEEQADWHFRGIRDRQNVDIWYYYGNYSIRFNFDDTHNVEMLMASWSSRGGWKDNAHILKFKKICATGKMYLPVLWQHIMDGVTDENNETRPDCPFPPGKYTLNYVKADLSIAKKIPAFFYGNWRLDFKIVDSEWDCISCMRIFLRTVPFTEHGSHFGTVG